MPFEILNKIRSLLHSDDSRSQKLKSNIILSILLKGISILVTFLLVPATIDYVDSEVYGIWLTLAAILVWFQILDIGIAPGLKNKLTEALAADNIKSARSLVSTTYASVAAIFVPLSIVLYFLVPLISWAPLLNVSTSFEPAIVQTLRLLSILICIQMISNIVVSVLAAYQRVALSQSFLVIGNIVALVLIIILSHTVRASLPLLALVLGGAPIVVTIIGSLIIYNGMCRQVRPSFSCVEMRRTKDLLSLGSKFFIINIQAVIVYQSSNFLISNVSSPEMVTAYNIAYRYLSIAIIIYTNITLSLWTAYTDAYAKGDRPWMMNMRRKMNRLLGICIILCLVFAAFASPVYSIWIGDKAVVPTAMTWWVAAYVITYCFMTLNGTFIIGTGKVFLETIVVAIGAVLYIPAALFAAKWLEQYGILATLVTINIIYGLIFSKQTDKLLDGSAQGIWNR
ncbi:MAG: lipopolysaccharide biosynthesis protein [Muribaculaceae bacterium]